MKKNKKAILEALKGDSKTNVKYVGLVLSLALKKLDSDDFDCEGPLVLSADRKMIVCCLSDEESYVIPEGVEVINEMAFHGKKNTKHVKLPSTLKRIEKDAFSVCQALEEIDIPESVETINGYAFADCDRLHTITFNSKPGHLARSTFADCDGIRSIYAPEDAVKPIRKALHLGEDSDYLVTKDKPCQKKSDSKKPTSKEM